MWRGSLIALRPAGLKLQLSVQVTANINNLGLRRSRRGCRAGKHSRLRLVVSLLLKSQLPGNSLALRHTACTFP